MLPRLQVASQRPGAQQTLRTLNAELSQDGASHSFLTCSCWIGRELSRLKREEQ